MTLNWTLEVPIGLILGILFLLGAIFSFRKMEFKNVKTPLFFRLAWLCLSAYFTLEALSYLFLNLFLARVFAIMAFPATVFILIGINYNSKDSYYSFSLLVVVGWGAIVCFLAFQPDAVKIVLEEDYYTIIWTGWFNIMAVGILALFGLFFFMWVCQTLIHAPIEIKRNTFVFFIGALISNVITNILYIFTYMVPRLILLVNFLVFLGLLICNIMIMHEPKILFILPFEAKKIFVKNSEGNIIFEYNWGHSAINKEFIENIQFGFLNRELKHFNKENLIEIHFSGEVIMLFKTELYLIGLIVSKPSQFLRDLLPQFSQELTNDISTIPPIVEKYFNIFPSRLVHDIKQKFLISKEYYTIPTEIEKKMREIFTNKEDYDFIKCEFQRSPEKTFSEFLELYEDYMENLEEKEDS